MEILQRHLAAHIEGALGASRVVNIVGPRQTGKTTLFCDLGYMVFYATLDDGAVRAALEADAYGNLFSSASNRRTADVTPFSMRFRRCGKSRLP